jgi:hypothetical protein
MKISVALLLTLITAQTSFAREHLNLPNIAKTKQFLVQGMIHLPKGQKLNEAAPSNITVLEKVGETWTEAARLNLNEQFKLSEDFQYSLTVRTQQENSPLKVKASLYHCNKINNQYCVIDDFEGDLFRKIKTKEVNLRLNLNGSPPP